MPCRPAGQIYLLLVLLLKWVLVGRMTAEKCRRTDLLWRFNNHLWKLLQVGGLGAGGSSLRRAVLCSGISAPAPLRALPCLPASQPLTAPPHPLDRPFISTQDLPMYRTSSDPWTGTEAFNSYMRALGAKVGKQVRTGAGRGARLRAGSAAFAGGGLRLLLRCPPTLPCPRPAVLAG